MKTCSSCKISKNDSNFYRDRSKKDGLASTCKSCTNTRTNNWIASHRAENNERNSEWQKKHPEFKRASNREYRKNNPDVRRSWDNSQRSKFPEKFRARQAVKYAIKTGKLVKQPCEVCGDVKSQAHHDDYSKPLDVRWLCRKHHDDFHKKK